MRGSQTIRLAGTTQSMWGKRVWNDPCFDREILIDRYIIM